MYLQIGVWLYKCKYLVYISYTIRTYCNYILCKQQYIYTIQYTYMYNSIFTDFKWFHVINQTYLFAIELTMLRTNSPARYRTAISVKCVLYKSFSLFIRCWWNLAKSVRWGEGEFDLIVSIYLVVLVHTAKDEIMALEDLGSMS